jgi:hypothetical protein
MESHPRRGHRRYLVRRRAATASALGPWPGGVVAVDFNRAADWLVPLPVDVLRGISARQANVLRDYDIRSVGLLAAVDPATVQRLLGVPHRAPGGRLCPRRRPPGSPSASCPPLPASALLPLVHPRRRRHARPLYPSRWSGSGCRYTSMSRRPRLTLHCADVRRQQQLGGDPPPEGAVRTR